jgi:hypothetical protein
MTGYFPGLLGTTPSSFIGSPPLGSQYEETENLSSDLRDLVKQMHEINEIADTSTRRGKDIFHTPNNKERIRKL